MWRDFKEPAEFLKWRQVKDAYCLLFPLPEPCVHIFKENGAQDLSHGEYRSQKCQQLDIYSTLP